MPQNGTKWDKMGIRPRGPPPSHWLNLVLTSPHLHQLNIFLFLFPHHPCSNGTAGGFKSTAGDLCPGIGRHRPTGVCRNTTMPPCPAACLKPCPPSVRRKSVLADCLPSYYHGRLRLPRTNTPLPSFLVGWGPSAVCTWQPCFFPAPVSSIHTCCSHPTAMRRSSGWPARRQMIYGLRQAFPLRQPW